MASFSLDQRSVDKVLDELARLPKDFSTRRKKTILKQSFKPFINAAINKAPKDTGDLALSIDTITFRNNKNSVFAGPKKEKKIKINRNVSDTAFGFYAHFIEYGFDHIAWPEKGKRLRDGAVPLSKIKPIPPRPFLRPAWDATKQKVFDETIRIIRKRLAAIYKKNIKI